MEVFPLAGQSSLLVPPPFDALSGAHWVTSRSPLGTEPNGIDLAVSCRRTGLQGLKIRPRLLRLWRPKRGGPKQLSQAPTVNEQPRGYGRRYIVESDQVLSAFFGAGEASRAKLSGDSSLIFVGVFERLF